MHTAVYSVQYGNKYTHIADNKMQVWLFYLMYVINLCQKMFPKVDF